jgi:hypothetical protein
MTPVLTRPSPANTRRPEVALAIAALVVVAASTLFAAFTLVRSPDQVDRVTVVNRLEDEVDVDVVAADGTRLALTVAPPTTATRVTEVVDQGDAWTFEVSGPDGVVGRIRLSGAELAAAGWRVVIPASLGGPN